MSNFKNCKILDVKAWGKNVVELATSEEKKLKNVVSTCDDSIVIECKDDEGKLTSFMQYKAYKYSDILNSMCKVLDQILSSADASTNDVFDQVMVHLLTGLQRLINVIFL